MKEYLRSSLDLFAIVPSRHPNPCSVNGAKACGIGDLVATQLPFRREPADIAGFHSRICSHSSLDIFLSFLAQEICLLIVPTPRDAWETLGGPEFSQARGRERPIICPGALDAEEEVWSDRQTVDRGCENLR